MENYNKVSIYGQSCILTAETMLVLFEKKPSTTEIIAAHAFFCRSIDHFRGALILARESLDIEAIVLVRGIVETTFVIGALLTGKITTEQLEAYDRAGLAKGAKAQADYLKSNASEEMQRKVKSFADQNAGPILNLADIAKRIQADDLYDGFYRMFSHIAAHPTITAAGKYLDYSTNSTDVVYPGVGRKQAATVIIASTAFIRTCAAIEKWLGTTPEINRAINDRLTELEALGSMP